jgi:hypothetical protein
MGTNLGPLNIKDTYQQLVQISGSVLTDGSGSAISSLNVSASYATTASFAENVTTPTLQQVINAGNSATGSIVLKENTSTNTPAKISLSSSLGNASLESADSNLAFGAKLTVADMTLVGNKLTLHSGSDTYLDAGGIGLDIQTDLATIKLQTENQTRLQISDTLIIANVPISSSLGFTGSLNGNATTATSATSASYATTASFALNVTPINTGSFVTTASISDATITFTKGDASTFDIEVNNVSSSISASYATTAASATTATSASYASTATSASHAVNAETAYIISGDANVGYPIVFTNAASSSFANLYRDASPTPVLNYNPATNILYAINIDATNVTASGANFTNLTATSASIGFLQTVTGSATIIGDAFIILNTSDATRYAGIKVEDSGSATPVNYTASWFYDSQLDDWNYSYSSSGGLDYAVALFGPHYSTQGSPTYLTNNRIPKSDGDHHLNDSNISDDGSKVSISTPLNVTGAITASGTIKADGGILAQTITGYLNTNLDLGTLGTGDILLTSAGGDIILTGSIDSQDNITAPTFIGALQGNADTATTASYALTASFVDANAGHLKLSGSTYYATDQTLGSYDASVVIGQNANSAGYGNVAIGYNADVTSTNQHGTAVGESSQAGGSATAVGKSANASDFGVAIGNGAVSSGNGTTVGRDSNAGYLNDVFGYDAQATGSGNFSLAMGRSARANGANQIAIGAGADAGTSNYTLAIGRGALATGSYAMDIRVNNASIMTATTASQDVTFAGDVIANLQGNADTATTASFAVTASYLIGGAAGLVAGSAPDSMKNADSLVTNAATAAATGSIVFGDNASVSAGNDDAIAIGRNAQSTYWSVTIGRDAQSTGIQEIAIGRGASSGNYGAVFGFGSTAGGGSVVGRASRTQQSGVALGGDAYSDGSRAIAIGAVSQATTDRGLALGDYARATGSFSFDMRAGDYSMMYAYTGSATVGFREALRLDAQDPLPTGDLGMLAVSGSALYFHNGSTWAAIS